MQTATIRSAARVHNAAIKTGNADYVAAINNAKKLRQPEQYKARQAAKQSKKQCIAAAPK